jgi:lipoprotein-anchoring transpeptidase ErfK/SrfK
MHGTPDAASIGYSASHGCIRMRIPDAEWLYQRVRIGTPVVIVSA